MNILANELSALGFEITLIAVNSGPSDQINLNCEVIELSSKSKFSLRHLIPISWKLWKVLLSKRPELIIVNCELPELLVSLQPFRKNLVSVEHTDRPWIKHRILGRWVRKNLEFRNTQWVVVSKSLRVEFLNNRVPTFIPNPITEENDLRDSSLILNSPVPVSRLVFLGRLSKEKRPHLFLELCLRMKLPGLVIGDGVLMSNLIQDVYAKDLKVNFLGQQLLPWDFIQVGDLVVIPSEYEGDGRVLAEACALGVPTIVSDIRAFREYALPEDCYIKDFNSLEISKLQDIRRFRASEFTRDALRVNRNPSNVARIWANLIMETFTKD